MTDDELNAVKAQMQTLMSSYVMPGVVSPNALHPQLVLDLVNEVQLLREDVLNLSATVAAPSLASFDYAYELNKIKAEHQAEVERLYQEIRDLQKDLQEARKKTAKKKTGD